MKEMKSLLQQRDQSTSGSKAVLARRLESGDRTCLAKLLVLGWKDKLQSHEDNIASLLVGLGPQGDRSLSRERGCSAEPRPSPLDPSHDAQSPQSTGGEGKASDPIQVESGSNDDDIMSTARSA